MDREGLEDAMVSTSMSVRSGLLIALTAAALAAGACGSGRPGAADEPAPRAAPATAVVPCSPVAAHPRHGSTSCATCHLCRGAGEESMGGVVFDPVGAAVAAGQPPPAFSTATKSCTSVACHGVAAGTFAYYFPGGDGEPELITFAYGGGPQATPSWQTTGLGCGGCHGNPPRNATWHGGYHAGQGPTGAANQCQFCHPDATGSNGVGTAITNAALHGNRVVDVVARWRSTCFGCH